jgi:hypothetical protein
MQGQLLHGSVGEGTYLNVFHTMFILAAEKKGSLWYFSRSTDYCFHGNSTAKYSRIVLLSTRPFYALHRAASEFSTDTKFTSQDNRGIYVISFNSGSLLADVMRAKPTYPTGKLLHIISTATVFPKGGALLDYYCCHACIFVCIYLTCRR